MGSATWREGGKPKAAGSSSIAMPAAARTYELRLFSNGSFTRLAVAGPITVTAPPPASLNVTPSTVVGGGAVTANWNSVTNPSTLDWIGVFQAGAPDTNYLDFR